MSMQRFTRLTNGCSKKLEKQGHAVELHFSHYNFCRIHKTLRVTPAMEAGLADHIWRLEELCKSPASVVLAVATYGQDIAAESSGRIG